MNYAQARQIQDGPNKSKWHWTTRNGNVIRPDGYCSPWVECPECHGHSGILAPDKDCSFCHSRGIVKRVATEVCDGHDTAEEAEEHYRQYRIDNAEFVVVENPDVLLRCRMCDDHTASYMQIKGDGYFREMVCPKHHERETAELLITRTSSVVYS